jgi:hypothetical protein
MAAAQGLHGLQGLAAQGTLLATHGVAALAICKGLAAAHGFTFVSAKVFVPVAKVVAATVAIISFLMI